MREEEGRTGERGDSDGGIGECLVKFDGIVHFGGSLKYEYKCKCLVVDVAVIL